MSLSLKNLTLLNAACTEGGLDVKYLSDRYGRGTTKVKSFMELHQRYVQVTSVEDSLPDVLEQMQHQGGSSQLGQRKASQ